VRFDVEAAGRAHVVEMRRGARGWLVTIDGRAVSADVTRTGDRWSLLIGPPEGGPRDGADVGAGFGRPASSYEIAIEQRGRGEQVVHVNGRAVPVSFLDPRTGRGRRRDGHAGVAAAAGGPVHVKAPMAGRIVKVLVNVGEPVAARQGVVVVEAMKMENELRAPSAGTVRDVRVVEGASIESGAVLVVIE
jgi:biotin carboxyl carrier protein